MLAMEESRLASEHWSFISKSDELGNHGHPSPYLQNSVALLEGSQALLSSNSCWTPWPAGSSGCELRLELSFKEWL